MRKSNTMYFNLEVSDGAQGIYGLKSKNGKYYLLHHGVDVLRKGVIARDIASLSEAKKRAMQYFDDAGEEYAFVEEQVEC